MPRSSQGHSWENSDRNIPHMRNNIPEERRRLINRIRGIEGNNTENEAQNRNRQERRANGQRNNWNRFRRSINEQRVVATHQLTNNEDFSILEQLQSHLSECQFRNSFLTNSAIINEMYSCYPRQKNKFKYIKSYNYIPENFNFNKLKDDNNNLFFGIELEVDKGGETDGNAKTILDILGENNCYIMHDGSLQNGLEITSHPCSYNYHLNMKYRELFNKLVELGYKSHDTTSCGLHIHVNRNYFGNDTTIQDLCITKLLFLVEKYWDNLVVFSRRNHNTINRWARRYEMNDNENMFDILYKAKNAEKSSLGGKYHSINLKHKNTIEFRIFRGTLKYNTFIATIQLVKRLVEISKNQSIEEIQLLTWEQICNIDNKELKEYLLNRNLM